LLEVPVEVSTYPVVAVAALIDVNDPPALPSWTAKFDVPATLRVNVDPLPLVEMLLPPTTAVVDPVADPLLPESITIPPPPPATCQVGAEEVPVDVSTYPEVAVPGAIDVSAPAAEPICTAYCVVPLRL